MTEATEAGDFFGSVPDAREGLARAGYLASASAEDDQMSRRPSPSKSTAYCR